MLNRLGRALAARLRAWWNPPGQRSARALRRLRAALPEVYWFRDRHSWQGALVVVQGSAAFRERPALDGLRVLIGGQAAELSFGPASEPLRQAFWFLPETHLVGFTARLERAPAPVAEPAEAAVNFIDVTLDFAGAETPEWLRTFQISPHFSTLRPVPDNTNIERVSGRGATSYNYWNNGRTDFRRFSEIAAAHGLDVSDRQARILDWGCGCARLTRHLRALPNGAERVQGIDIDAVNIGWCREHIAAESFAICPLVPPAGVKGPYDLIIGNSVLTHLTLDVMALWLAELERLLAPGGIALLSYHGDFSAAAICSGNIEFWEKIQKTGFDASIAAGELNDAIGDPDYYRQTFMTDRFAKTVFAPHFQLERVYTGVVSRYQNVAVLRKNPG